MTPKQVEKLIVGEKIKELKYAIHLDQSMCIEEIILEDGTKIALSGCCDDALIDDVTLPDGEWEMVRFEDE